MYDQLGSCQLFFRTISLVESSSNENSLWVIFKNMLLLDVFESSNEIPFTSILLGRNLRHISQNVAKSNQNMAR